MQNKLRKYTLGTLSVIAAVVLLLFVWVYTGAGLHRLVPWTVQQMGLIGDASLSMSQLRGNIFDALTAEDIALTQEDGTPFVTVERLHIDYALFDLLTGNIHLEEVAIESPLVELHQEADSTWDLLNALQADKEEKPPTEERNATYEIDLIQVKQFHANASFYAMGRDSTYRLDDIHASIQRLVINQNDQTTIEHVRIDSLDGRLWIPQRPDSVALHARGTLSSSLLNLESLRLASLQSQVAAAGKIALPPHDSLFADTQFALQADPLAFDDIRLFAGGLFPGHSARILVDLKGASNSLVGFASVMLSDSSSLETDLNISAFPDSTHRYRLNGTLNGFNPSVLDTRSFPEGNINAQWDIELTNTEISNLTGASQLTIFQSQLFNQPIDSTVLTLDWDRGQANLSFLTGFDGTSYTANGSIAPFSTPRSYDLEGSVTDLHLETFLDSSFASTIDASWRIEGQGMDPEDATVQAGLAITPSRINQFEIEEGTLEVALENARLDAQARILGPSGNIGIQTYAGVGEDLTVDSLRGQITNLDIAALLGDTTYIRINGGIDAQLNLANNLDGRARIDIWDTQYDTYGVQQSETEVLFSGNQVQLSTATQLVGGDIAFDMNVNTAREQIGYTISEGVFNNVNLGVLLQQEGIQSMLNGSFSVDGSLGALPEMQATGRLALTESTYNEQPVSSATTQFELADDSITVALESSWPDGGLQLAGFAHRVSEAPSYGITQGVFRNVDLGAFVGDSTLATSLTGYITANGRGTTISDLVLQGQLNLRPSAFNAATIEEATVDIDLQKSSGRVEALADIDDGTVEIMANLQALDTNPAYDFIASLEVLDVDRLMGQDSVQAELTLEAQGAGVGLDPNTLRVQGTIHSENSFYGDLRIEQADLQFDMVDGLATIDSLYIASSVATITGEGPVAIADTREVLSSDFAFSAELLDVSPLAPLIGADLINLFSGSVSGRILGRPGVLRFDSRLQAAGLVYNTFRMNEARARIVGEFASDRSLASAEIVGAFETTSIPGFVIDDLDFEASYTDNRVSFDVNTRIDSERGAVLKGSVGLFDAYQEITFEQIGLQLDNDLWQLQQPALLRVGTPIVVEDFLLTTTTNGAASDQSIALDGVLDVTGDQDLTLDITKFDIGTVAELAGFPGLDGIVNTRATLKGAASAPRLEGLIDLNIVSFDREAGDFSLSVQYDSLRLDLDATMKHVDGNTLTMKGYLPVDLRLAPPEESTTGAGISRNLARGEKVDLVIRSDSMAIGWLLPFIDAGLLDRLDGVLTADFTIAGESDNPVLSGSGKLIDGTIRSPLLGVTYRGLESDLVFRENVIYIQDTQTRTGDGRLTVNGQIALDDLANAELDIQISANQFNAINTREYRSTVSGNLQFTGTFNEPTLNGDIRLLQTDVFLENTTGGEQANLNVQLTEEDLLMLEREFGIRPTASDTTTFDLYEALAMDIDIVLERDTWIRSLSDPEMNVQFNGELDLTKRPYEDQAIFGSIEVNPDRSYITQFGKRFEIDDGNITFNGPISDLNIDFVARYEVPSRRSQDNAVTIYMDVEGTMENLDLTLRSDPTMELTDMVSYVVTGQPASEALQLGGLASGGAGEIAVNQGVGLLSGAIESLVQDSGLELDVIQIEPQADARGARITAGKYVTPRLFTAVTQPVGAFDADGTNEDNGTIVTVELELLDSLLLRLLGGESVMQINLLWHYAY